LRGLTVLPGFRQSGIQLQRAQRLQGATNYNFKRSLLVALDGILSFSTVPLRIATFFGLAMTFASFLIAAVYIVWHSLDPKIFGPGWPSLFISVFFIGGLQFIVLGILGEYLARVFIEVQNRPVYWVDYELGFCDGDATSQSENSIREIVNA
jgi:dolichol-phosphate mannosyltransferase